MPMRVTFGIGRRRGLSWLRRIILEQVMHMKSESQSNEKKILKAILWVYIGLCVVIAGLNYGYAPRADAKTAHFLTGFWHFYENWVKTAFILIASILTIRITSRSGRTSFRRKNLIALLAAALVVHVVLPLVSGNYEWYFFTMPLPWTTSTPSSMRWTPRPMSWAWRGKRFRAQKTRS